MWHPAYFNSVERRAHQGERSQTRHVQNEKAEETLLVNAEKNISIKEALKLLSKIGYRGWFQTGLQNSLGKYDLESAPALFQPLLQVGLSFMPTISMLFFVSGISDRKAFKYGITD
ncbi:hypothetical protein PABG_12026 [Paracoccidioides brasiliensis Pb03]|nr:hypothetical protein PABG_12026 [Paracoccidioides brasiliensis Pb03]